MMTRRFRKTNHQAIAGFLLPFAAAGTAAFLVLGGPAEPGTEWYWIPFVTIIPILLLAGLVLSIRSLPRIKDLGDKDYAYSGLVLNLFFLVMYAASLIYYVVRVSPK